MNNTIEKKPFLVQFFHTVGACELDQKITSRFAIIMADDEQKAEEEIEAYLDRYFFWGFVSDIQVTPFTSSMIVTGTDKSVYIGNDY